MEYNNWLKDFNNKTINDEIDKILIEKECYNSSDDVIRLLLNSLCELKNSSLDIIIRNAINDVNKKKCKECEYIIDTKYNKCFLRCINCKYINHCNECMNMMQFNYKYKFERLNRYIKKT